jgi:hypothetical protein
MTNSQYFKSIILTAFSVNYDQSLSIFKQYIKIEEVHPSLKTLNVKFNSYLKESPNLATQLIQHLHQEVINNSAQMRQRNSVGITY